MFALLKLVRAFIGGKTELGLVVLGLSLLVFILPIAPGFTWGVMSNVLYIVGAITGTALASRIEDKEGVIKALQSLFGAWRKK